MSILVHVGVRASDIQATIRFWRDGLGLQVVEHDGGRYDLTDGYHNFRVFQHQGPSRPPHVAGMLDYLHIGVVVPDLVAAATRLRALDYEIFSDGLDGKEPVDLNNLTERAFKVEDPDGITVDVTESDSQWPGTQLGYGAASI
ncbi:MAG: VOC family protein [Caldilineaceae bacterium]